jgi:rhomboid protease GluP
MAVIARSSESVNGVGWQWFWRARCSSAAGLLELHSTGFEIHYRRDTLRQLFRLFKAIPVTWLMLFTSGLLWAAANALSLQLNIEYSRALNILGAESRFRVWDGAWWTILTTAYLLCNTTCLWWLGRLLETRLGSWRYLLFCLSAIAVAGACQSFWSPYVGLSGMLYAQFGLIWAWRRYDAWLQAYVQDEHIQWGVGWLLICLPLTWFHILEVGNAAHVSGCIYGYVAGRVCFGTSRARFWKPVFLISHVFLIPAFYFLVHPEWDGTYHWRRGDRAVTRAERRHHFQKAVYWDPDLDRPWLHLAVLSWNEGKRQEAWNWMLRGLQYHPSYQDGINLARGFWIGFPDRREREMARQRLRQIFGDQSPAWEKLLLIEVPLNGLGPLKRNRVPRKRTDATEKTEVTIPPFTLPPRALDEIRRPPQKLPAPDPNAEGSAEEGRAA